MAWTLVGQQSAIDVLASALTSGRVSHAYLFAGAAHTGKTLASLEFAQALNCTGDAPPCGRCHACERVASRSHPDIEIVSVGGLCNDSNHPDHAKDNSTGIRICQVRRIDEVISRAPFEGRYRVVIIEPAEAMREDAQNALLKTLEEPPPHVVLILVTEHEDLLLETIRSRARRVAFHGLARNLIERSLRSRWDVEPQRAAALARLSGGRIGWAVLALHDERMMQAREDALASAEKHAGTSITERVAWANELGGRYSKDRAGVQATLEMWQEWWRDILLIAAGRSEAAMHRDRLDRLHVLASQCDVAAAVRGLRAISDARQQLEENASPALALEVMVLALPLLRPNAVAGRLNRP